MLRASRNWICIYYTFLNLLHHVFEKLLCSFIFTNISRWKFQWMRISSISIETSFINFHIFSPTLPWWKIKYNEVILVIQFQNVIISPVIFPISCIFSSPDRMNFFAASLHFAFSRFSHRLPNEIFRYVARIQNFHHRRLSLQAEF